MAGKYFGVTLRISIIVLAVALLAGIAAFVVNQIEPRYQGRSLTAWLNQAHTAYDHCPDPEHPETESAWVESQAAVRAMGTKVLPFLLRWTQAKDSRPKIQMIRWLNEHPFFRIEIRPDPALRKHLQAMHGFALLRDDAKPAVPALIQMTQCKNRDRRFWGFVGLAAMRPDKDAFLPVLTRLIHDPDPEIKSMSADIIHRLYPEDSKKLGVCELFPEICNPTNAVVHTH